MKKKSRILLWGFLFSYSVIACSSNHDDNSNSINNTDTNKTITIMSYNILNGGTSKEELWNNRKAASLSMLQNVKPDIIGMQEVQSVHKSFYDTNLTNYKMLGLPRDNTGSYAEYCAIYYRSDKFTVLDSKTIWLSETPEVMSKSWGSAYYRICTYAKFRSINTGEVFFFFNTHLDYTSEAFSHQISLLESKIKEIAGDNTKIFVTGDFNMEPSVEGIVNFAKYFKNTRMQFPESIYYYCGTFHDFGTVNKFIDYVWYRNAIPKSYSVINSAWNGVEYVSDHYPIVGVFSMN
jgi:endonuclease/exonuclease/phosphatase family metal-dependent hydrolase